MIESVIMWWARNWEPVVALLGAFAGAGAAFFAAIQIRLTRQQEVRSQTMQRIDQVVAAHAAVRAIDVTEAQEHILHCQSTKQPITGDPAVYQDLLDALDILAFAVRKRMASLPIATDYLDTLLDGRTVSSAFLQRLREVCGHDGANKDLLWLLEQVQHKPRFLSLRGLYDRVRTRPSLSAAADATATNRAASNSTAATAQAAIAVPPPTSGDRA